MLVSLYIISHIEVDCAVRGCKVKKKQMARHVKSNEHPKGLEAGGESLGRCSGE